MSVSLDSQLFANPHDRERLNCVLLNGLIKQCGEKRKLGMTQRLSGTGIESRSPSGKVIYELRFQTFKF